MSERRGEERDKSLLGISNHSHMGEGGKVLSVSFFCINESEKEEEKHNYTAALCQSY